MVHAQEPSKSVFPYIIALKFRFFWNSRTWKNDRDNLLKHKTRSDNDSIFINDLDSMIKNHRESLFIDQS